ncbi:MAG: hypothetical protein WCI73_08345 [Phycisphaerae bacterium]
MKRIAYILLVLGVVILVGSIFGYMIVDHVVPEPEGSDPQKEQYLFGLVSAALFGVIVLCTGGMVQWGRGKARER